jgi:hypothetical protein
MQTPRPLARTRRTVVSLVIAASGLAALAGCDPRTMLYFLQPFEPTVPAPGPSLKDKKIVILTHVSGNAMAEYKTLDRDLTREVVANFRKTLKSKVEIVNWEKVSTWMEGHPNWTDPGDAGRAFEADMVIFLEVESFQVASITSPGMLEGNARTHIQAFEMEYEKNSKDKPIKDKPKEAKQVYEDYRDSVFPTRGPMMEGEGVSRAAFKNRFLQVVAAEISWHFVEHSPEDDIQDVRFNGK